MNIKQRISDFYDLGRVMKDFVTLEDCTFIIQIIDKYKIEEFEECMDFTYHYNPWFTPENIRKALSGLAYMLSDNKISTWVNMYPEMDFDPAIPKRIGLVMAGNIPLVGFPDLLAVLISGNHAVIKLSASDNRLLPQLLDILYAINPDYRNRITIVADKLKDFDAVIATGSNNTARYFDYYFGKYPNIIRKNRNGVAVITGNETVNELKGLADDIFSFFGLGCRNVSKIYVPEGYKLDNIFEQLYDHHDIINHHKYANNFDYNRTVMMLNKDDILENGFVIFKNSIDIASPLACVFYERYNGIEHLRRDLELRTNEIQCIVSSNDIPFGQSQKPELWDYADGVDTLAFLGGLDG
jgi:hypothetical protein